MKNTETDRFVDRILYEIGSATEILEREKAMGLYTKQGFRNAAQILQRLAGELFEAAGSFDERDN